MKKTQRKGKTLTAIFEKDLSRGVECELVNRWRVVYLVGLVIELLFVSGLTQRYWKTLAYKCRKNRYRSPISGDPVESKRSTIMTKTL